VIFITRRPVTNAVTIVGEATVLAVLYGRFRPGCIWNVFLQEELTVMFQVLSNPTILVFPFIIGVLAILAAVFNQQLLHAIGLKPLSTILTTPRFQRSARITEQLGRLLLAIIGVGFLLQGVAPLFLSVEATNVIALVVGGLAGLIMLAILMVVFAHWRIEE
jgi:hypothetical protein